MNSISNSGGDWEVKVDTNLHFDSYLGMTPVWVIRSTGKSKYCIVVILASEKAVKS